MNTFGFVMGFWDYKKFNRIYKRISPTFYMFQMIYTILYKTCSSSNSFDENRVLMHFQDIDFLLVSLHEMFSCHFPWKITFREKMARCRFQYDFPIILDFLSTNVFKIPISLRKYFLIFWTLYFGAKIVMIYLEVNNYRVASLLIKCL